MVTEVLRQSHRAFDLATLATQTIFDVQNDDALRYQAALKAALIYTPPPPSLLNPEGVRGVVAGLREEDVILTAEIRNDGAATIMYVVPPNDPSMQAKLDRHGAARDISTRQHQPKHQFGCGRLSQLDYHHGSPLDSASEIPRCPFWRSRLNRD